MVGRWAAEGCERPAEMVQWKAGLRAAPATAKSERQSARTTARTGSTPHSWWRASSTAGSPTLASCSGLQQSGRALGVLGWRRVLLPTLFSGVICERRAWRQGAVHHESAALNNRPQVQRHHTHVDAGVLLVSRRTLKAVVQQQSIDSSARCKHYRDSPPCLRSRSPHGCSCCHRHGRR